MQWLTVSEVIKTDGYLIYMEDHSRSTVELIPWPVCCHWMMNLYELPFKKPFFVIQQPTGSSFDGIVWFTDDIKAFFSCNIGMRRERILVMFHAFWPPCDLIVKQICTKNPSLCRTQDTHLLLYDGWLHRKSLLYFPHPWYTVLGHTLTTILKIVLYCCLNTPFLPQCTFKTGFIYS